MILHSGGAPRQEDGGAVSDWLTAETVRGLEGAAGNPAALREVVLFYLHCAYQARITPETIYDLFGDSPGSVLSRAKLSAANENAVMDAFEEFDAEIAAQHRGE